MSYVSHRSTLAELLTLSTKKHATSKAAIGDTCQQNKQTGKMFALQAAYPFVRLYNDHIALHDLVSLHISLHSQPGLQLLSKDTQMLLITALKKFIPYYPLWYLWQWASPTGTSAS
ncbi:hypothetical protein KSF_108280 [Reticulibacter mediterranei]|uniref:Uncharacterized protein n=1 Tax=Reticulibacter mediterranei TaxID=2778369 RepID=A0A8J3N9N2_9CHLR|nr:hypothetical protein KSF_108280 [Reticulibacter mediterranei]